MDTNNLSKFKRMNAVAYKIQPDFLFDWFHCYSPVNFVSRLSGHYIIQFLACLHVNAFSPLNKCLCSYLQFVYFFSVYFVQQIICSPWIVLDCATNGGMPFCCHSYMDS